jgi:putative endonuclease
MQNNKNIGSKGEDIACEYLLSKGYKILNRNWIFNHKEVDVVAVKDNELVFVEMKTRNTDFFEDPYNCVSKRQQKCIIDVAEAYINKFDLDYEVRFDVVGIVTNEHNKIVHIESAFGPEW